MQSNGPMQEMQHMLRHLDDLVNDSSAEVVGYAFSSALSSARVLNPQRPTLGL